MSSDDLKNEFDSLLPGRNTEAGASRRTVLKVALGLGYAASILPVMAQTAVNTSAEGLRVGTENYDVAGTRVPFYYAAPKGKMNLPVILVVQEIFGVHEYIADVCRRFAQAGYLAIAPELFVRQGDAKNYTDVGKLLTEVVAKVPDEQVMNDLDAAVAWAGANGGDLSKLGITGFCWGGRITWLYSQQRNKVRAGVAWYGRLTGDRSALTPAQPLDLVASLKAPILGLYAGQDAGIPLLTVNQMKDALAQAARNGNSAARASQFVVYPEAGHAFHADYRPSYVQAAAADGFSRCLAWFKDHGVV